MSQKKHNELTNADLGWMSATAPRSGPRLTPVHAPKAQRKPRDTTREGGGGRLYMKYSGRVVIESLFITQQ